MKLITSKKAKAAIYFASVCIISIAFYLLFGWLDKEGIYKLPDIAFKIISFILFVALIFAADAAHKEWVQTRSQWKKWDNKT